MNWICWRRGGRGWNWQTRVTEVQDRPLVSIIVPSFNQGRFIRRTLESIFSQDYRPLQVIVIDGASKDDTVDVLRSFDGTPGFEWVSEPDSGVVEAVNKGFARARGVIGGIQSSDDFYLPGAIRAGVEALQSDPALGFVFGDIAKVDAEGSELAHTALAPWSLEGVLLMETWIPQPSTFFRMELAKSLGGWRELAPYSADTDLWLRMALQQPAKKIDRLLAQRSVHDAQRDTQGAKIARDYGVMIDSLLPEFVERGLGGAARAGKLLMANRYAPPAGELVRVGRLWRAAWSCPKLLRRYPVRSLIPGGNRCRAALSRYAHRLGLR